MKHTIVVDRCCFSELLIRFIPTALSLKHNKEHLSVSVSPVGPILLVEPQPKTVDVDSDVTLNCKWAGNPPLTLTWFKKGSNMVRSEEPMLRACLYSHCFYYSHFPLSCLQKLSVIQGRYLVCPPRHLSSLHFCHDLFLSISLFSLIFIVSPKFQLHLIKFNDCAVVI